MVAGLGAENQIAKIEASKAKLARDYPDIEVVATVSSNDEMQVSLTNAQNLIKTYPELKGIVGFAGGEAPSAAQAIEQAVDAGELEKVRSQSLALDGQICAATILKTEQFTQPLHGSRNSLDMPVSMCWTA